ncbi:TIGR02556 family CRISPR-associated protein [Desulfobacula toluolica]|uniref:TM1: CRISPR-associated protein, TM1802 family n=1 Tax=Desulfobacula toluolica (strain DSM 7467 / Tol2) TaxID=651182 RepID=K0NM60_DESTT|nr:TIGR02556 family CRISPR-associated protein [Desulfobacula toluolica]CCK81113.1 TM1: CRISPR-associated protein, TM1802 family [Desulfobacula toluolica Tol2]
MIKAIAELGRYAKENNPEMTAFDIWLEDSYDNGKYDIVFFVVLKKDNEQSDWRYKKIDISENGKHLKNKLIYKRGSPRGTDKTPTAKVAKSIASTFRQKIKAWFESKKEASFLKDSEKEFLNQVFELLSTDEERIIKDLEAQYELIDAKGVVLSLQFVENSDLKYIGDFDFFSGFIVQESKAAYKFSKTFKKHSFSNDKVCSVCNNLKQEVFGYFTSLGFYTVDKPGMVTGGFRQDLSWKNYPVCLDCALDIENGIKFKEEFFDFRFYGFRYYLIPTIINDKGKFEIIDAITDYNPDQKINSKSKEAVLNPDEEVFDLLKDYQNHVHFNLLFYDKPNKGVFRILENIEEVLPSRIRLLYETKEYVDGLFIFKNPEKDGKRIFRYSFGILRDFFPRDKIRGNHDKDFLQIVRKIFSGLPVQYDFLVTHIMRAIRNRFVNNNNYWFQALSGFMMLNYFYKLGLLNCFKGADNMTPDFYKSFEIRKTDDYEEKVDGFFDQFNDFFKTNEKRGIFLLGVLTQLLLNIQEKERGSTPFRSQLKGLKMDSSDITGLLPKLVEKLEQYKKNYYMKLEKLISKYFISSGDHKSWNLTIDEMNYVFVLGMNLSKYFKIIKEQKEN